MERTRTSGLTVVGYAVLAYAAFLVASAWAVTFLADVQLPRGINHGTQQPAGLAVAVAIAVDLALLLLFALQHSVMARSGFKHWAARWIPPHVERSTYVLATSLVLLLLFWQWQPVGTPIWDLHGVAAGAIWALYALGWLIAIGSTFMVDHLDVFGLRRAYRYARSRRHPPAAFQERWLYGWVRHPLMLGLLVAFWATPRMTAGHLLFATASTGYILVGVQFEEHDLEHELGDLYRDYASRVPAFLPVRRPTESRQREATGASDALMVEQPSCSSASPSVRVASPAKPDREG